MRLTKTSLIIIGITLLLAITDQFLHNWMGQVWPLVAAIWLFLLFAERAILFLQKITIQRKYNDRFYLGRTTTIEYSLQNDNKYPIRLMTSDALPGYLDMQHSVLQWDLSENECLQQSTTVTPIKLGKANFQRMHVTILGRLVLAWWTRHITVPNSINIQPDYKDITRSAGPKMISEIHNSILKSYPTITLVINADQANQVLSGGLRRSDHYLNVCSTLAYRALSARRVVNIIVYDEIVRLCLRNIRQVHELAAMFTYMSSNTISESSANHHCVVALLEKIHSPGLLIWCSDFDDARQTSEIEKITRQFKQKFKILAYSQIASEKELLAQELMHHCRNPHHKLAILDLQEQWRYSRQILQRANIQTIAQ